MAFMRAEQIRDKGRMLLAGLAVMVLVGCQTLDNPTEGDADDTASAPGGAEIIWDEWGVPHIKAERREDLFYAYGWAQARMHADLLLKLYGRARGRAAEYWGPEELGSDRMVHTLDIPARAGRWLGDHDPDFQRAVQAFADGINKYAKDHPGAIGEAVKVVLPVTANDVLAHLQVAIQMTFVGGSAQQQIAGWQRRGGQQGTAEPGDPQDYGSNAWAVAPSRTRDGKALLYANPHLPWEGLFLFFESHWNGAGVNAYGVSLVGAPVPAIAFNEHLGWTHTVNTYDGADLYELTLAEGGYRFDGETRPFEMRTVTLRIKNEEGGLTEQPLTVMNSVHGPVVAMDENAGKALALRIAGWDRGRFGEQYWDMLKARNLTEFKAAMSQLQQPMFNTVYADRHGEIYYLFNAVQPRRSKGDFAFWSGIVPGDTSDTLWTDYLTFDELPAFANPESGWIQNANDPPWTSTFPQALRAEDYASYIAPQRMSFRPQSSARLVSSGDALTLESMIALTRDTAMVMAERILPDLLPAAREAGDPLLAQAADVLEKWDRRATADSRGGVLFLLFARNAYRGGILPALYAEQWSSGKARTTPAGLSDPAKALPALRAAAQGAIGNYGALDVPWGDVFRLRRGGKDLPASVCNGVFGCFRVGWFRPDNDGKFAITGGNSYVMATEFGDRVRARGILAYGNATQEGVGNNGEQLELHSEGRLRDAYFYPEDIEAHARERMTLPAYRH